MGKTLFTRPSGLAPKVLSLEIFAPKVFSFGKKKRNTSFPFLFHSLFVPLCHHNDIVIEKMNKLFTVILVLLMSARLQAQTVEPDPSGMGMTAQEWTRQVKMGWNLGNSLESQGGETAWGNPKTTQAMIKAVKAAGFNAIRIPVRWSEKVTSTSNMNVGSSWLARVKEIVDWALNEDMYVIINTHHEEWLDRNPFYKNQQENNRRLSALWTNIATYFRDYDQRLAFAGTNEVISKVNGQENWGQPTKECQDVQNSYNQSFVDAVRATGGKNYYRHLVVQCYACNPYYGMAGLTVPADKVEGRLSVEFHCYDPYEYAGSGEYYYWGDAYKAKGKQTPQSNEQTMSSLFDRIRNTWGKQGLGVVLGEYGVTCHYTAQDKQTQMENEQYFTKCMVSNAREHGFAAFVWDNNVFGNGKETFGVFDRKNNMAVKNTYVLNGIKEGSVTEYKEPGEQPGGDNTGIGDEFWSGNAVLDWGSGLQLNIPAQTFAKYGKDVLLVLSYQLDYRDYNSMQFFYGDWDGNQNVSFTIAGKTYVKEYVPSDVHSAGSGENCTAVISFSEPVFNLLISKGFVLQGHGIRLTRVALTSASGIHPTMSVTSHPSAFVHTLGGHRVKGESLKPGIYVRERKKVVVK